MRTDSTPDPPTLIAASLITRQAHRTPRFRAETESSGRSRTRGLPMSGSGGRSSKSRVRWGSREDRRVVTHV